MNNSNAATIKNIEYLIKNENGNKYLMIYQNLRLKCFPNRQKRFIVSFVWLRSSATTHNQIFIR